MADPQPLRLATPPPQRRPRAAAPRPHRPRPPPPRDRSPPRAQRAPRAPQAPHCACASEAAIETIAPPAGSAPISRPRAATSAHASWSEKHARDVRRRQLPDRMAQQKIRAHPPILHQPEQRHLQREQPGLREHRLRSSGVLRPPRASPEHHIAQRAPQRPVQMSAHLLEGLPEHRERLVELPTHPDPLGALAGEQERDAAPAGARPHPAPDPAPSSPAPAPRSPSSRLSRPPPTSTARSSSAARAHRQREPNIRKGEAGTPSTQLPQRRGLAAQAPRPPARDHPRDHPPRRATRTRHVRSRHRPAPADRAGPPRGSRARSCRSPRTRRPPRGGAAPPPATAPPRAAARPHPPTSPPAGWAARRATSSAARPWRIASAILITPPTPAAAWAWPMFDFTEPSHSGRSLGSALSVDSQQCLRLDRIAQRRARAVPLHRVHLARREPGARERLTDHALLGGAVGRRQAVARAILIDGAATHHGEHLVIQTARVREALQHHHPDALAAAHALRPGSVGSAPPSRASPR